MTGQPLLILPMVLLAGCSLRVSSPAVTFGRAEVSEHQADLTLRIDNPNRRSLTLVGIDYTLTDGAFPIARGSAPADATVPGHGSAEVPLHISFDPPLGSAPDQFDLRGTLRFLTGPLGFAEISENPFAASSPAH